MLYVVSIAVLDGVSKLLADVNIIQVFILNAPNLILPTLSAPVSFTLLYKSDTMSLPPTG